MKSIVLSLLFLSGCAAMNPQTLREQGIREQFVMRQSPAAAAACVARKEEAGGDINTSVREGAEPGRIELVVFHGEFFYVTAEFAPQESGSIATAWISPQIIESSKERHIEAFQGC